MRGSVSPPREVFDYQTGVWESAENLPLARSRQAGFRKDNPTQRTRGLAGYTGANNGSGEGMRSTLRNLAYLAVNQLLIWVNPAKGSEVRDRPHQKDLTIPEVLLVEDVSSHPGIRNFQGLNVELFSLKADSKPLPDVRQGDLTDRHGKF